MDEAEKNPVNTRPNPNRREAFARALAEGATPDRAAERAGYAHHHGKRVEDHAVRPDIAARIIEIRTQRPQSLTEAEPLISQLLDAAGKARLLNSAAGYAAVRGLLAEAARLQSRVEAAPEILDEPPRIRPTREEWLAKHGPNRAVTP